ncbi:MAG: MCE family protein, partial [Proteobacteria bacterium]|nr:MCE family protein [Pseudomonadota bacterium]
NLNKATQKLSSILEKVDKGEGVAGALLKDEELARELKETIRELKELTKDIKEHPKKYFKFSMF